MPCLTFFLLPQVLSAITLAEGSAFIFTEMNGPLIKGDGGAIASLKADRNYAVRKAWEQEQELVRMTGKGTVDWPHKKS
jgi:hypothetical protein